MVAGTRTSRTTVASRAIATAIPRPSILIMGVGSNANPTNTATMIAAADEITRPVLASPVTTLAAASPVRTQSSRTRDSRKTS